MSGSYTAEQALTRLLSGTSLSYRLATPSAVVVEVRVGSDSVEVHGAIPRIESTKYTTALGETPQSIQIIPRTVFEEQGATTLSEVLRSVPGITMQAGEGGGASSTSGDMFNMRGFSAANSLFVDGVRDDGLIARDVYNLEQVEVFSGPTGSDVGRTNAAGYINLTPRRRGSVTEVRRRWCTGRAMASGPRLTSTRRCQWASPVRSSVARRCASTPSGRTAAWPAATKSAARACRSPRRWRWVSARRRG